MNPFTIFQKRMLINYIWGSAVAVFGVGSLFIFHTLQLEGKEVFYLLFILLFSVTVMLIGELLMYRRHVRPIRALFKSESVSKGMLKEALRWAYKFPQLTVQRILGPHLLGLSIPASVLAWMAIHYGLINLPLSYIGFAWMGAVLIAVMHALIEFFLTDRAVQLLLPHLHKKDDDKWSIKGRLT